MPQGARFALEGAWMECPVCSSPDANEVSAVVGTRRSFKCTACGEYDIAVALYDRGNFHRLDKHGRLRALDSAKRFTKTGERPVITSYDL